MRCSKCGAENPERAKFCVECASPFVRRCPSCNAENPPTAKFCLECAKPLPGVGGKLQRVPDAGLPIQVNTGTADASLEGERKTVTTLFADIKGSMDLEEGIDPEDARAIVDPALKLMIDSVHHYDGYVAQSTGDGIFALFGAPVAHEDDPQRALHAAIRMQEGFRRHFAKLKESRQPAIEARVGVHTGEVVVRSIQTAEGRSEYVPVGHSIGLAARMQALAPPGSIAVTDATRKLCEGYFNFRSLGPAKVKGVSETVEIYEVTGVGALRTRLQRSAAQGLTRFIGRDDEMRTLWNRWELAREGEGQLVLIAGEAGIGKSRVVHQFHERLGGTSHRWVEGDAEPYFKNTPFHAAVAMVNQAFGLNADQTPGESLDRLEGALLQSGIDPSEAVAPIAQLLNLSVGERYRESTLPPEQARKRLLGTLVKTLFALAASQPMVLAIEDLHWADASTLEFLELLVEQAATAPVMVLLTCRPEFGTPWPIRAHHAQITLGRLRDREVREMVAAVAAKAALTNQAIEGVTSRASGIPLFVEELTRAVLERDGSDASPAIPETLQNSLVARLDRLGAAKEAAQVASVIGREFSYQLLSAISALREDELQSSLMRLADAELIYARGIAPDASYIFKHVLIRDAAYETLLKSRRKELHRSVAQTIADRFPAMAEAKPEALARHWTEAGNMELAFAAWQKAADAAFARHALKEAEENYRQAAEALKRLPDIPERDALELKLVGLLAQVLHNTKGYAATETVEASARARELARKSGTFTKLYLGNFRAWLVAVGLGDYSRAALIAKEILELARLNENSLPDEKVEGLNPGSLVLRLGLPLAGAHGIQHITCHWRGDLPGSESHFLQQNQLFARAGHELVKLVPANFSYASWTAWKMGRIGLARQRIKQATAAAHGHEDPEQLATVPMMAANSETGLVDSGEREALALDVIAQCEKLGIPALAAEAQVALGRARLERGGKAEGLELIQEGIAGVDRSGTHLADTYHYTALAEALLLNDRIEEALAAAEKAVIVNPNEGVNRSEAYRIRGVIRLTNGMFESAEADFREAIALSQSMSAKLLELRSTTSLARLLGDTNRRDEARRRLADIYNWFTEGFDTADLKDAKALLDELGG